MKSIIIISLLSICMYSANAQDRCNDPVISPDTLAEKLRVFDSIAKRFTPKRCRIDTLKTTTPEKEVLIDNCDVAVIDRNYLSPEFCESLEIINAPFIQNEVNQCLLIDLKRLRTLKISGIRPLRLSECFGKLNNIDSIIIDHNKIDTIPDFIFYNKNLKYLSWQSNCTKFFGECANTEVNITSLLFLNEVLSDIPNFLLKAKKLRELIFSFDVDADYSKWKQVFINNKELIFLVYGNSKMKEIPNEIFDLKLVYLGIHSGCLESVSSNIQKMNKVKIIDFSNNRIVKLPEEIKELQDTLDELYLSGNPIPKEEQVKIKNWLPKTKIEFE